MQRRATIFPIFIIFLLLSGIIFLFARGGAFSGFTGFFENGTVPLQRMMFGLFHNSSLSDADKLRQENAKLLTQLAKQKELESENRALHDQFEASNPNPTDLLPAQVIGMHDDQMVIDKGSRDHVMMGDIIVSKDNLVGKIVKVSEHLSVVSLVISDATSFTAKQAGNDTPGVVKGTSDGLVFGNVVLSDTLNIDAMVVTKGDVDGQGNGFPPDLIVGKIISVNKQPSALFQTAEVKSLINFSKLSTVFILKSN